MTNGPDFYHVLSLARNADATQIRAAYIRLVKANHPDGGRGDTRSPERLRLLRQAYHCLRHPACRAAHDAALVAYRLEHDRQIRRLKQRLRSYDALHTATRIERKHRLDPWRRISIVAIGSLLMVTARLMRLL